MLRRLALLTLACLVAVAAFALWMSGPHATIAPTLGADWTWYVDGARRFADPTAPLYLPEAVAGPYDRHDPGFAFAFNQPPTLLPLIIVVDALFGSAGALAWWAACAAALVAALVLALPRRLPPAAMAALLIVLLAQGPMFEALGWGNVSALVPLGALLLLRPSPRAQTAGLLLMAIKGPIALAGVLYLLRAHGRRALGPLVASGLVVGLFAIPALLRYGPGVYLDFLAVTANSLPTPVLHNLSLPFWLHELVPALPTTAAVVVLTLPLLLLGLHARGPWALVLLLLAVCTASLSTWAHWYAAPLLVAMMAIRPRLESALRTAFR